MDSAINTAIKARAISILKLAVKKHPYIEELRMETTELQVLLVEEMGCYPLACGRRTPAFPLLRPLTRAKARHKLTVSNF